MLFSQALSNGYITDSDFQMICKRLAEIANSGVEATELGDYTLLFIYCKMLTEKNPYMGVQTDGEHLSLYNYRYSCCSINNYAIVPTSKSVKKYIDKLEREHRNDPNNQW